MHQLLLSAFWFSLLLLRIWMLLHHVWQHNLTMLLKNGDLPSKSRTSSILTSLKLGFNLLRGGWAYLPRTHKIGSMCVGLLEAAVDKIRALSDSLDILLPWDNTLHFRLVEIILSLHIMIARIDIKSSCGIIQVTWIFIDRSWDVFNVHTCDWNLNCPLPVLKSVDLNNYCCLDLYEDFPERIVSFPRGESLLPATILSFFLEVDITLIYEKLEWDLPSIL